MYKYYLKSKFRLIIIAVHRSARSNQFSNKYRPLNSPLRETLTLSIPLNQDIFIDTHKILMFMRIDFSVRLYKTPHKRLYIRIGA